MEPTFELVRLPNTDEPKQMECIKVLISLCSVLCIIIYRNFPFHIDAEQVGTAHSECAKTHSLITLRTKRSHWRSDHIHSNQRGVYFAIFFYVNDTRAIRNLGKKTVTARSAAQKYSQRKIGITAACSLHYSARTPHTVYIWNQLSRNMVLVLTKRRKK